MNIVRWLRFHRRSILFLLALLAGGGILAAFNLPVSLFPNVDFPRVVVNLDSGDRPAEQMLLQVTIPVEEAIRRVPGVKSLRSTTTRGAADISINFGWGTEMAPAALQVNAAISQIIPTLPAGTHLETRRMDPTVFPIIAYSLTSDKLPLTQLRDMAQFEIRPLLSSIEGVARVHVLGGALEEYQVMVDPARLQAYGLSLDDVSAALSASNVITAVGRLEDHYKLYLAISDTRLLDGKQIGMTVLKSAGNGVIHLRDVAEVRRSVAPQWLRVNADGHDAVLFPIYQQPGGNSVLIDEHVKARLASFKSKLPADVNIANWYDQSELVVASAASVRDAILVGIALAAIVIFVFLRNSKVTFIAVLVVPAVLAITIVLLHVFGMSFNIMTLGGMAAAVGLIIDDAIVMVEHIMRRLHTDGRPRHERVMNAAMEFFTPLAGSSAATLVIFVPLAFLDGVTGAFFKALSLTMAASLFISFIVTWLAVPILADHWLSEKDAEQSEREGKLATRVHHGYAAVMNFLLAKPVWLVACIAPLLLAGVLAYGAVGTGFMPSMDEGGFVLDYRSAPGTSLTETDRLLRQLENIIKANPNVETYSRRTGASLGGHITEANEGDFFVRLKPQPRAPIDEVMDDIREKAEKEVPGLNIELAQLMEDLIGDLTAVPQPIEVKIYSDDQDKLMALARKVAAAIGRIPGVVDVRDGINPAGDALEIHVDRVRAALEGVDPDGVTHMLGNLLGGNVTTAIQSGPKMIGVRVWTPNEMRDTDTKLDSLLLRAPDGHMFPLKRVADIVAVSGQPQINRDNLKRMVAVTGRISGRDMGSAMRDVRQMMDAPGVLPAGVYYELGGLYQQQQHAFHGLLAVLAAASALVFLLLLFLYERFRLALSIMAIPMMSLSAVFVVLWATRIELNISAMMGMTMIVGIVTEVAIFYFSEYQQLAETMPRRNALIQAGINRMRPIAMTTLAAILTLLPLALAIGQGSAMQQPLAIAIIAGLAAQFPLVLVIMPVLFELTQKSKNGADKPIY